MPAVPRPHGSPDLLLNQGNKSSGGLTSCKCPPLSPGIANDCWKPTFGRDVPECVCDPLELTVAGLGIRVDLDEDGDGSDSVSPDVRLLPVVVELGVEEVQLHLSRESQAVDRMFRSSGHFSPKMQLQMTQRVFV